MMSEPLGGGIKGLRLFLLSGPTEEEEVVLHAAVESVWHQENPSWE